MAQTTQTSQSETQKKNTAMAIVAYILFFVPLFTEAKTDPFVKYHVKQGFLLFIWGVAVSFLNGILPWFFRWISKFAKLWSFYIVYHWSN